ncbi:hypothetical protein [Desulfosporosinus sp. SB140]|uniref:hypothetical protein n=1 Tax=Desulfosporosinus paludis TaxID=3115649 RepID=UPI00388F8E5C
MSSFEIRGLTEFERYLTRVIGETYPAEAKRFMQKQANDVKTQAMHDTPDDVTKAHWKTATQSKRGASADFIESTVTNHAPLSYVNENGHRIVNQDGEYGFSPGVHMLEKAMIKKETEFSGELNVFISRTLEELEL